MTIRVAVWLLREALGDLPDDTFVEIDEQKILALVSARIERRGTRTLYRTSRGRFAKAPIVQRSK